MPVGRSTSFRWREPLQSPWLPELVPLPCRCAARDNEQRCRPKERLSLALPIGARRYEIETSDRIFVQRNGAGDVLRKSRITIPSVYATDGNSNSSSPILVSGIRVVLMYPRR